MKTALVCGAGGFIGSHLVRRLKQDGFWVRGADLKLPEFSATAADDFMLIDLRTRDGCRQVIDRSFDEVYQLAADMGGAGYIFAGDHDAQIMSNSALINLGVLDACQQRSICRLFFSSSACVYPHRNQKKPFDPITREDSAYPAEPDSEYGWEKLFSERLYASYARNFSMTCRVARYHNVFGPDGAWRGGREKVPAALCRKIAEAADGGPIEIWGDGCQTRSFLFIDECIEATIRVMRSSFPDPVNIGSDEMVTINQLAAMIIEISHKKITLRYVAGPTGVRGRTSDNRLIREKLGWAPTAPLRAGLETTFSWVERQVAMTRGAYVD